MAAVQAAIGNENKLSDFETVTNSFTADYDGYIYWGKQGTAGGNITGSVKINDTTISVSLPGYGNTAMLLCYYVSKGDTIVFTGSDINTKKARWFKNRDYSGRS